MNAGQLARELARDPWWASQPPKMRILAARYYAGVDSLDELIAMAHPAIYRCCPWTGDDLTIRPALTDEQVETIILLR